MLPVRTALLLAAWLTITIAAGAGGIRGMVRSDDGGPLPYASIYVKETGTGSATDASGRYEISLPPGRYQVYFQFLGYETQSMPVTVGEEMVTLDVKLKSQSVQLQTITVRARKEDPAYAVMRRAIARARYHLQQVDSFSAMVYIKGKGKLKDYPFLAKKMLEKEGITKDRLFIQESVSEIHYRRPNKFSEKVVAIYTQGKNATSGPNEYVFGSLYEPEIAETVSPLSPKAFSYYRFEYLGIFRDQQVEVNKIRVIPRSKGDNVFEGTINIVEDLWSIHSVDLNTSRLGAKVNMKSIYNPVVASGGGSAWMPVNQQFIFQGSVFGFEFEGQYLATVRNYKVYLNPALKQEIVVTDSKQEEPKPAAPPVKSPPVSRPVAPRAQRNQQVQEKLEQGKEVSDKELTRLMRSMERDESRRQPDAEVLSDRTFRVDSTARKKDSLFWAQLRPAPLETEELKGYLKADSIAKVEKQREEGDSSKASRSKGFQWFDLIMGDRYKIGKTTNLEIMTPYGGFNTVEGFHGIYRLKFSHRWVLRDSLHPEQRPRVTRLEITPVFRYAFAREKPSGILQMSLVSPTMRLTAEGGRYVQQLNPSDPIHPLVNSLTSLWFGRNYMKLLERDYLGVSWRWKMNDNLLLFASGSWSDRRQLDNATDYTMFSHSSNLYTSNQPLNAELPVTDFLRHQALIATWGLEARPWQKYRIRNGRKYRVDGSPLFTISHTRGFSGLMGSDVDYDKVELGVRQGVRLGFRGRLDYRLQAGTFLNSKSVFFPDFNHFSGNRTLLITSDPVSSFRLLDYYRYSTTDQWFSAVASYHFRKLFVSRIPKLHLLGVRENIFGAWLTTPALGNYFEAGFGLDGILRVFRVEAAVSFLNGEQRPAGLRLGVIGNLGY